MFLQHAVLIAVVTASLYATSIAADLRQLRVVDLEERLENEPPGDPSPAVQKENKRFEEDRARYTLEISDETRRLAAYEQARDNPKLAADVRSAAKGFALMSQNKIATDQERIKAAQPFSGPEALRWREASRSARLEKVLAAIRQRAETHGVDLVFDVSAKTHTRMPFVLHAERDLRLGRPGIGAAPRLVVIDPKKVVESDPELKTLQQQVEAELKSANVRLSAMNASASAAQKEAENLEAALKLDAAPEEKKALEANLKEALAEMQKALRRADEFRKSEGKRIQAMQSGQVDALLPKLITARAAQAQVLGANLVVEAGSGDSLPILWYVAPRFAFEEAQNANAAPELKTAARIAVHTLFAKYSAANPKATEADFTRALQPALAEAATRLNLDLILERDARTRSGLPYVAYFSSALDITNDIKL